tara:strand:- start:1345 stop:2556 length:1212 start_codon:yes stop_codon:yes gene_type:complete
VVTGMGIVSCIGNDLATVTSSLQQEKSGISFVQEYADLGLRSQVAGIPDVSGRPIIDRKIRRFMSDTSIYSYYAMSDALADSQLDSSVVSSPRTGLVVGSGVGSPSEHMQAVDALRSSGLSKAIPYAVPRIMGSTTSASLSTAFGIQGISCSMTSACATSAHCIGYGLELIQFGKQDVMIVGGAEEVHWTTTALFDAMGALSTAYNDNTASRPYDISRDGFVIAGGAGVLVLEELESALQRGAHIYAEITGYGVSSDGLDMVLPSTTGAVRAMQSAINQHKITTANSCVDYINAHATSTPLGDISEIKAIEEIFEDKTPLISSTKGLTGHPIAASAVHEAIYSMLMLKGKFLSGCANLTTSDPTISGLPVLARGVDKSVNVIMSNSFGFGGTNASLIFQRYDS